MARPIRIEYNGALYHVTSRGNSQQDIYLSDEDRVVFLEVLRKARNRFNGVVHAYCLMTNHYHLLIETPEGNLSQFMRHLNGVYTQRFNFNNRRTGHLFEGRYKSILVQQDLYLLELARYVVLNPVRAGMVRAAKEWPWSSYRATAGLYSPPEWLNTAWILSNFSAQYTKAIKQYRKFVSDGKNQQKPWQSLSNQVYLGDQKFIDRAQNKIPQEQDLSEVPAVQRRTKAKSLGYYKKQNKDRNAAIIQAFSSGGYSMKELGKYFGLHYSSISRIVSAR